jgi:hypothetical protein
VSASASLFIFIFSFKVSASLRAVAIFSAKSVIVVPERRELEVGGMRVVRYQRVRDEGETFSQVCKGFKAGAFLVDIL